MARGRTGRVLGVVAAAWAAVAFIAAGFRVLADCSAFDLPFTDLGSTAFCAQIAEAYFTGLSNGTSATTYSPSANVPREQMAAFVTRTLDQSLLRGTEACLVVMRRLRPPLIERGAAVFSRATALISG